MAQKQQVIMFQLVEGFAVLQHSSKIAARNILDTKAVQN